MPKTHGSRSAFTLDTVDLTTNGALTNIGFPRERETSDASAIGDTDREHTVGLLGGTISLAGWFDATALTGPDTVLDAGLASGEALAFEYGPAGDGVGAKRYSGAATVTAYEVTSPLEDTVAFTATLTIQGAVTSGAFS